MAAAGARLSPTGHAVTASSSSSRFLRESLRTCVGCRGRADRSVLLRVVAAEVDGVWSVVPDVHHKRAGRGASLHLDVACFGLAERRRAFPRALRRSGPLELALVRELVVAAGRAREVEHSADPSDVDQNRPSRKRV